MAERRSHHVAHRLVHVRRGTDHQRVLAAGLGQEAPGRCPPGEAGRRLVRTGEHHGANTGGRNQVLAYGSVGHGQEPEGWSPTPAACNCRARAPAVAWASGAGLRTTALPAARAASVPPAGIAYGKFQGGATTTVPKGWLSTSTSSWPRT